MSRIIKVKVEDMVLKKTTTKKYAVSLCSLRLTVAEILSQYLIYAIFSDDLLTFFGCLWHCNSKGIGIVMLCFAS